MGFAINVKAHLSIGRSLLLPLLRIPPPPGIKAIAFGEARAWRAGWGLGLVWLEIWVGGDRAWRYSSRSY
ncbi:MULTISPECIES: hypothetical protein [unclassified Microcoleus]|uniref:hypothetical protein n=1 Tax=unclassified Microcoleus TaxID=2642155 RepID=UPI002FD24761